MFIDIKLLSRKEKKYVIHDIINTHSLRSIFGNGCAGPENFEQIPLLMSHGEYLSHSLECLEYKTKSCF